MCRYCVLRAFKPLLLFSLSPSLSPSLSSSLSPSCPPLSPPPPAFDYPASLISTHSVRNRALSEAEDGMRVWHLFKQPDVEDPRRSPFLNKKMITEVYLPRMLSTKCVCVCVCEREREREGGGDGEGEGEGEQLHEVLSHTPTEYSAEVCGRSVQHSVQRVPDPHLPLCRLRPALP